MSVTFSGGITFTGGGFSFSAALPSTYTAGWWTGGGPGGNKSTVQRITFATDTNTASIRGPLSIPRQAGAGVNTFTYGWIGGGAVSTIDRITFASDTSTASARGSVTGRNGLGGTGNDTYGYYAGGGTPTNINAMTTVNRITYTTDTDAASTRGPLSSAATYIAGTGTNNYGYFGGGVSSGPNLSTVNRVDYANDTPTTSVRGPLSSARYGLAASTDSTTYGWYMAGYTNIVLYDVLSRVDRITYATDTATASIRGPLTIATYTISGAGDSNYGWVAGTPGATIVNRITYATDTATASSRGPLASSAYSMATCSGAQ
jgi:hypothetical protein